MSTLLAFLVGLATIALILAIFYAAGRLFHHLCPEVFSTSDAWDLILAGSVAVLMTILLFLLITLLGRAMLQCF